jgi:CDP-diacylglycerol--inositol 3-phosphatidyltransferase
MEGKENNNNEQQPLTGPENIGSHSLSLDGSANTLTCPTSLSGSVNSGGNANANTTSTTAPLVHKVAMCNIGSGKDWFFKRHRIIPVYIPNIIGYLRIICSTVAIALAFTHPRIMLVSYFFSFVCDELDGRFARLYGQQSTYGAVLDMVTDRLSTAALLGILAVLYPSIAQVCLLLTALDIASHWCHMHASLVSGGTSHKVLSNHHNWLVRSYYANRIFMGTCCVSCEVLYLSLYALHFPVFQQWVIPNSSWWNKTFYLLHSQLLNYNSITDQAELSVFVLFAEIAILGFVIKQTINVIQLVQSMHGLWLHDLKTM